MSTSSITGSHGSWMINDLGRVGRRPLQAAENSFGPVLGREGHDFSRADKFFPYWEQDDK